MTCAEFYLQGVDHIFGSHYARGSTLGSAKRRGIWMRMPVLRQVIAYIIGSRERDLWVQTAQRIVNSQSAAP